MKRTALISIIFTAFWASLSLAQTCPQVLPEMSYEPLESIAGGGQFEPVRVAVDNRGNVYVTDKYNKNLKVFDYRGNLLRRIDMDTPTGVAVDGSGRIYVGRAQSNRGLFTGEVIVYDSNFTVLHSLGKGWGEFQNPSSIATDASRVYVADNRADVVKVYDIANGLFLFQFGGYGFCDIDDDGISDGCGYLISPSGIYVHPVTKELYIADRALFKGNYSGTSEWGPGAAVHVFTRDGAFIKKFGSFNLLGEGELAGSMISPVGVIIDSANRVMVSDFSNGYLHVFRDDGTPICTLDFLSFPKGLEFGEDNRLFIATASSVAVRGIDGYVTMSVEPKTLSFSGSRCITSTSRDFVITNGGPGTLAWAVMPDKPWIWIDPAYSSGSTPGKSSVRIPVRVDISNLAVGIHRGSLTVSAQGVEEKVDVTVEVFPLPELKASRASLSLSAFGSEKPTETLSVELSAGGSGWSASSDSAWLGVSPPSGPSGAISVVGVAANTAILGSGDYSGSITISANCALGSPITVPVTLAYKKGGTISVTTNTPEATFTISGPDVHNGNGSSYTVTGVNEGTYTIVYGAVEGMREPISQSLAVADGDTIVFNGIYEGFTRSNIMATMGAGQWYVQDELRIFSADGRLLRSLVLSSPTLAERDGSTATGLRAGVVTAAGDVDGNGTEDLMVGNDTGIISGFTANGTPIKGFYFSAFSYRTSVDIAGADIDGDGAAEIIVGAGAAAGNPATVRVFKFKDGAVQDTGINILAFEELFGVHVAAGDVDGDGAQEILAAPGGGSSSMKVRVFRADLSGGFGHWGLKETAVVDAGMSLAGADVSAGDADGDGKDEIFAATVPLAGTARVAGLTADGRVVFDISLATKGGVNIAAGDTDSDGLAEIAVGENATPTSLSEVRVYRPDGSFEKFGAFDGIDIYGVRVSLGRIAE